MQSGVELTKLGVSNINRSTNRGIILETAEFIRWERKQKVKNYKGKQNRNAVGSSRLRQGN